MENLVYFPTFEPLSDSWLKFALLYVENFNPIIPDAGYNQLSDEYKRVIDETDLITPYSPKYLQGDKATVKAIEFIDRIKVNPYLYTNIFNIANVIRTFQNRKQWTFKIYEGKYTSTWKEYCLENEFGKETNGGILVTEEIAFIFMTFLAEQISFEEGKSIITDDNHFDDFLNFNRTILPTTRRRQGFAQGVLSLTVPKDISTISIKKLVGFRRKNRERIRAFNHELNNSLESVQKAVTASDFVERFNSIYSELTTEILNQGFGVATIPLSTYILIQNPAAISPEYINQIIGGLGIIIGAGSALNSKWKEISIKHNCRRYLTNLERLR
ncbi:MAG: hypothetical protein J0H29_01530 [Sphingobacteriales bacterium]|uniref:hypothetical protein n=1 Tax=uncultured Dysgonomonas sp. TaxID=206096 RepID=UPI00095C61B4|nr:hypothetical protein [uncultured Dysgonomonas sp.]MBN8857035.1 hypothetical protein [Sphingobacteriales bacterium]OJY89343.1 MAG: hypothetical protein BGP14_05420 [Sphingobacteriales bacterium 44-15]